MTLLIGFVNERVRYVVKRGHYTMKVGLMCFVRNITMNGENGSMGRKENEAKR